MKTHSVSMRVLAPNKLELWPSIALMVVSIFAFRTSLPMRPIDTIGFALVEFFSWVLAFNAALDLKKASWPVRALMIAWLVFITWVAIRTLPAVFTSDYRWADR